LALAPADRDARHARARAYLQLRQWDAARAEYEALLQADPADPWAHERLGALLLGDDPAAIQHLYRAKSDLAGRLLAVLSEPGVTDDPAYASARVGRILFEAQEWALAARQFERALALSPGYADAHAYLGYALNQLGQPAEALFHLQQAIAFAPDLVVARIFLGLHYDRQGDWAAARAEYEAAYDLDPENPAICVEIGETWAAEGNYIAAEIWLAEAVRLRPDDPALWEILARFYLDRGITSEGRGVEAAARLLALSPGDARAYDLRGWAALQSGDYTAAQDNLLKAITLDPALAEAHYHLGLLWNALGQRRKAQEAFVRAVDFDTTGTLAPLVERALGALP
jgi:tetratricopeptide (TPR) repeat protein